MNEVVAGLRGLLDNLNPLNTGNLVIYFTWLVVYIFTMVAIWRSNNRVTRLSCFLLNQFLSIGILLSWTVTLIIAYTYWIASLGTIVVTFVLSWWVFRERRGKDDQKDDKLARAHAALTRTEPVLVGDRDD